MRFKVLVFRIVASCFALFCAACNGPDESSAPVVVSDPSGFALQDTIAFQGLNAPVAMAFSKDGSIFVAEKPGVVKMFESINSKTPVVLVDIQAQVMSFWDRGLLGLELDPAFPAVPYVYLLYTYDAPIGGVAPIFNDLDNRQGPAPKTVSARLGRFTYVKDQAGARLVDEVVLIHDWCQQFPSHSIGSVKFGPDGALYASAGDGASFESSDWGQFENLCQDPLSSGGALRSQRAADEGATAATYTGSIIRIDPMTGDALPTNPLIGSARAGFSRIIAHGLRNPYRMNFRPGTNELWVGDVGWNGWEEVNRIENPTELNNFGWPCIEGDRFRDKGYSEQPLCKKLYETPGSVKAPYYAYQHGASEHPCGGGSGSISGLAFYEKGAYPGRFNGAMFLADVVKNCVWAMLPEAQGLPSAKKMEVVASAVSGLIVDVERGTDGDIFFITIFDGKIHRLKFGPPAPAPEPEELDPRAPIVAVTKPTGEVAAFPKQFVPFEGTAKYPDGRDLPLSSVKWFVTINHCDEKQSDQCHQHPYMSIPGALNGQFMIPTDHAAPSYLTLTIEATYTTEDGKPHRSKASQRVDYR